MEGAGGGLGHLQGRQGRLASAQGQTEPLRGARALIVNAVGGLLEPRESKQDFGGIWFSSAFPVQPDRVPPRLAKARRHCSSLSWETGCPLRAG